MSSSTCNRSGLPPLGMGVRKNSGGGEITDRWILIRHGTFEMRWRHDRTHLVRGGVSGARAALKGFLDSLPGSGWRRPSTRAAGRQQLNSTGSCP